MARERKLFCDINPTCYKISRQKEIIKRHVKDALGSERFARERQTQKLPNLVSAYSCALIKRGKGIDLRLQENKAVNIRLACAKINGTVVHPGEVFSFWKTVGKATKRKGYREGRILRKNKLVPGVGGGLCNLGNSSPLLVRHSPLKVTELHHHSDALAPDGDKRVPYRAGTSISYNNLDFRFRNDSDQDVQLCTWCDEDRVYTELRSLREFPHTYRLEEEDHHFRREGEKYFRVSKIYQCTMDRMTGSVVDRKLVWDNHSEVMFDYDDIPRELIRET